MKLVKYYYYYYYYHFIFLFSQISLCILNIHLLSSNYFHLNFDPAKIYIFMVIQSL